MGFKYQTIHVELDVSCFTSKCLEHDFLNCKFVVVNTNLHVDVFAYVAQHEIPSEIKIYYTVSYRSLFV